MSGTAINTVLKGYTIISENASRREGCAAIRTGSGWSGLIDEFFPRRRGINKEFGAELYAGKSIIQ